MRSKSLSSQVDLNRIIEENVAAQSGVQQFRHAKKMRWQLGWIPCQCGTKPFADLSADCIALDAIDLNAVWMLAGHGESVSWNSTCLTKSQKGSWFIKDGQKSEMKCRPIVGLGGRWAKRPDLGQLP
jgi:hypothetical protein